MYTGKILNLINSCEILNLLCKFYLFIIYMRKVVAICIKLNIEMYVICKHDNDFVVLGYYAS